MSEPAAITAQLVDVRNVAAHKSVRLELHVPAEQAGLVMAAFGWPTMADPVPVALARLHSPAEPIAKPESPKERRPFSELPYSQQAAMRCREADFQKFCADRYVVLWRNLIGRGASPTDAAADILRDVCSVISRTEIEAGTAAGKTWEVLEADYFAWSRGMR